MINVHKTCVKDVDSNITQVPNPSMLRNTRIITHYIQTIYKRHDKNVHVWITQ